MSDFVKVSEEDRKFLESMIAEDIALGKVDTSYAEFRTLLKNLPPIKDFEDEDE